MNGLLIIDKPGGMTSRDVVDRVERWFPRNTRVGHTGTLDPLATGVLVVCVGSATRLVEYVQAMGKTYRTRIRLGATSDTDDADGTISERSVPAPPDSERIEREIAHFVGEIEQLPPAYSALKVNGRRAHLLARKGRETGLVPRMVMVTDIRVEKYEYPQLDLRIDCGKGTYIRSIARDLGEALGCGGLVAELRRTRVGPYRVEAGIALDTDPASIKTALLPCATAVAGLPRVVVERDAAIRFLHGQTIEMPRPGELAGAGPIALFGPDGERLVGLASRVGRGLRPSVVMGRAEEWASG